MKLRLLYVLAVLAGFAIGYAVGYAVVAICVREAPKVYVPFLRRTSE